ncbi:ABC transporter protein [Streptococcus constellatus]|nr:ABC transporter protein [Streptococcus constellatus]
METILNVKHISKRLGQQLALDDVNLTVKQKNTASFD